MKAFWVGLTGGDVVPVDFAFVGEGEDRVRGELGAPPQENDPPDHFLIFVDR